MKRTKGDKGPGKGKTRISTTISVETDAELRRLAKASSLSRCAMARECIIDSVSRGLILTRHKSHAGKVINLPENPGGGGAQDAAS